MKNNSRTSNSIRNIKTGLAVQMLNKVLSFIVRTVFIQILNSEYLGVNGLFSNILTILSFAELGIGSAIIYNMYKPVAENNKEKVNSLMALYRQCYNVIGIVVFICGLLVIPFLNILIKDVPNIKENIILIYIMFLTDTAVSYFYTYKKSIIIAYQNQSIINNYDSIFYFAKSILQIIFLIITKNYLIYLSIQIISTILENIVISHKANKMYDFLDHKTAKKLESKEKKEIFLNVKSLAIYQFGSVIMNGTDNVLISSMINVNTVGLVSNYTLVINSIKSIIANALNGITASIGNLNTTSNNQKKEDIFYQMTMVYFIIYSFCSIAFITLLNPFIKLWLGKKYILNISISIVLSLSFFIDGLRQPGYIYRTTCGMFAKSRITPYIGAISNIVLSIVLCNYFGLVGIFIATCISQLISYSWIDPYLLHKYVFNSKISKYILTYVKYIIYFTVELLITLLIANITISNNQILQFIYRMFIVLIIPNIMNIVFLHKEKDFNELHIKFIHPIIKNLKRKNIKI